MKMTDGRAVQRLPVWLLSIEEVCSRVTVSCWSGDNYSIKKGRIKEYITTF